MAAKKKPKKVTKKVAPKKRVVKKKAVKKRATKRLPRVYSEADYQQLSNELAETEADNDTFDRITTRLQEKATDQERINNEQDQEIRSLSTRLAAMTDADKVLRDRIVEMIAVAEQKDNRIDSLGDRVTELSRMKNGALKKVDGQEAIIEAVLQVAKRDVSLEAAREQLQNAVNEFKHAETVREIQEEYD